jgi:hypothetical protein
VNTKRLLVDQKNSTTNTFKKALAFAIHYDLTKYDGTKDFRPDSLITREEAAKLFSQFAIRVLCRTPHLEYTNQFTDIDLSDSTLLPFIKQSYEL